MSGELPPQAGRRQQHHGKDYRELHVSAPLRPSLHLQLDRPSERAEGLIWRSMCQTFLTACFPSSMEGCAMTSLPHPVESARLDETHLLERRMTVLRLDVEAWPNME